jgi:hypothetical protein
VVFYLPEMGRDSVIGDFSTTDIDVFDKGILLASNVKNISQKFSFAAKKCKIFLTNKDCLPF